MERFILTILALITFSYTIAQNLNKPKRPEAIAIKEVNIKRIEQKANRSNNFVILGNYEVQKFEIISQKTVALKDLKALIGSLVKVNDSSITGELIDPMTFEIFEITQMNSDDYLFRAFGNENISDQPNLPKNVQVHKLNHDDCYGIVNLAENRIAIPYKGTLLYLKRK